MTRHGASGRGWPAPWPGSARRRRSRGAPAGLRTALLGAAVAALSGCAAGGVSYDRTFVREDLFLANVRYAARTGELPVEVVGNPFELPDGTFRAAVIESMQGHSGGPAVTFVPAGPETDRVYRLRVVASPTTPLQPRRICHSGIDTAPQGERLVMQAALCEGGRALSAARGATAAVPGPEAERFQRLMANLTVILLWTQDPRLFDEDDDPAFLLGG